RSRASPPRSCSASTASRTSCACAPSDGRSGRRPSRSWSATCVCGTRSTACAPTTSTWRASPAASSAWCGRTSSSTASAATDPGPGAIGLLPLALPPPALLPSALFLARRELLVLVRVHQVLELRLVLDLDLDQPALVVGVLVDDRGVVLEFGIDGGHRPGQRREQLRYRAYGLELTERLALLHLVTHVGELDGDDLAELGLAVFGDAELRAVALDAQPEVILGELENVGH